MCFLDMRLFPVSGSDENFLIYDFSQVFFNPEIYSTDYTTPLPAVIDKCIQSAPIDTRRALYKVKLCKDKWNFIFEKCLFFNDFFIVSRKMLVVIEDFSIQYLLILF